MHPITIEDALKLPYGPPPDVVVYQVSSTSSTEIPTKHCGYVIGLLWPLCPPSLPPSLYREQL